MKNHKNFENITKGLKDDDTITISVSEFKEGIEELKYEQKKKYVIEAGHLIAKTKKEVLKYKLQKLIKNIKVYGREMKNELVSEATHNIIEIAKDVLK